MRATKGIMSKATLILEKNGKEYWATVADLQGCFTTGNTIQEAINNAYEAVTEYLEDIPEEQVNVIFKQSNYEFKIEYDLQVFFEKFSFLNKTAIAEEANINPSLLRQYSKGLAFASDKQKEKIKNAVHMLAENLLEASI